jgi:hypothetical protein
VVVVSKLTSRSQESAGVAAHQAGEARLLADELAALRRVAILVAEAVPTAQVLEAVTREVGLRYDADLARMERFEPDGKSPPSPPGAEPVKVTWR